MTRRGGHARFPPAMTTGRFVPACILLGLAVLCIPLSVNAGSALHPLAGTPPTPAQVVERIGPSAIDLPTGVRFTILRTRTLSDGRAERCVERHARSAGMTSVEVLEPVRFGCRREGDRVWQMGGDGKWVEGAPAASPPAPNPPLAAGASPDVTAAKVRLAGGNAVVVEVPCGGGETMEWEVDWARRVVTGRRQRSGEGALRWEERREETRRDGVRWLLKVIRTDHGGGSWNYVEQWTWDDAVASPSLSALPGRASRSAVPR